MTPYRLRERGMSDAGLKPQKNWVPQIILCGAISLWQVYELMAPREAQSSGLVVVQLLLLVCGVVGSFGGLAMLLARR
jgi:hypothetical protein